MLRWGIAAAATLLLLGAPAAQAGVAIVAIAAPAEPLRFAESAAVTVTAEADCASILTRAAAQGSPVQPIQGPVALNASGGFLLDGPPTIDFPTEPCLAGGAVSTGSGLFQLTAGRDVLALQPFAMQIRLALPALGPPEVPLDESQDEAEFMASVQASLGANVTVRDRIQACACADVPFHVRLSNEGNARVTLTFQPGTLPGPDWTIDVPPPVVLDTPLTGGKTTDEVTLVVHPPPGKGWASGSIVVSVLVTGADDASAEGAPRVANLLVTNPKVKASYEGAPGVPLVPLLMAVGLAAAMRRK